MELQRLDRQTAWKSPLLGCTGAFSAKGQRLEDTLAYSQCDGLGSSFTASAERGKNKHEEASVVDRPMALLVT